MEDPFIVVNSAAVISDLEALHGKPQALCSLDIEDMYYSINSAKAVEAVEKAVFNQGIKHLESEWGMSWTSLREIMHTYLSSTAVQFEDKTYLQKKGVCIGSKIAPRLTDIYMASLNTRIVEELKSRGMWANISQFFNT